MLRASQTLLRKKWGIDDEPQPAVLFLKFFAGNYQQFVHTMEEKNKQEKGESRALGKSFLRTKHLPPYDIYFD